MRTVPPATAIAAMTTPPIPRRIVDAGGAGSLVGGAGVDELRELEEVDELAAPIEDDDAIVDELVRLVVVVVVEDALVAEVVEDVVEEDVDFVEDDEIVELVVEGAEDVELEEEEVDDVELLVVVDVELVDCAAIAKYADSVMFWVSVTVCAWLVLPPLQSSKT
jgi:hypothetical protein